MVKYTKKKENFNNENGDELSEEISGNENIYKEEGVNELFEEDAIDTNEASVMQGFIEDNKIVKCLYCKKIIEDPDYAYQLELDDDVYLFDTEEHKELWLRKHKKTKK